MKLKRLLTLIMAVCMVISVFPAMMASAEELATDDFEGYTTKQIGDRIPLGAEHKWSSYANRAFSDATWQPIIGEDPEDPTNRVLRLDKPLTTTDASNLSIITNNEDSTGKIIISFDLYVPSGETYGESNILYNDPSLQVRDTNKVIQLQAITTKDATSDFLDTCYLHLNRGGNPAHPKFSLGTTPTYYDINYNEWTPIKFVIDTESKNVEYYFTGKSTPDTTKSFSTTYAFDYFKFFMKPQLQSSLVYVDNVNVVQFTAEYAAQADADAIDVASVIKDETVLPTTGSNGSTIAWESNVDGLIVDNKIVPMANEVEATLTATVTYGDATETRTFDVKVLKAGTIFADSFETDLGTAAGYNNWSKFTPDNNNTLFTIAEDVNDLVNPTNKVLKLNKLESETANNNLLAQYIDRTKGANDLSISFRMKSETQSEYHMQVIDDNNGRKVAFDLGFNYETNSIYVIGYDNVNSAAGRSIFVGAGDLNINQWQDVKVYIDMDTKTFWLYLDGECLTTTAIPFENSVPAIAAFRFRGHADSKVATSMLESVLLIDDMEIVNEAAPEAGDIQIMYKNFSGYENRDVYIPVRYGYIWNVKVAYKYVGKTAIFAIYGSENDIETEHLRMLSAKVVTLDAATTIDHKISPYGKVMKMFIIDELGNLNPVLDTPLTESIGYLGHEEVEE